ncbi:hypothetical protein Tco_0599958 [Tanacetum coccineum]
MESRDMPEFAFHLKRLCYAFGPRTCQGLMATDADRVRMRGRLNLLQRDRRAHAHTVLLMEREAKLYTVEA